MDYKSRKLKLNTKLVMSLVSLIVLVIISIGVSINSIFQKKFESYVIKNNEEEISKLIKSIELEYKDGHWDLRAIDKIGKNAIEDGIFINLYDNNNDLIWSAMKYNQDKCHAIMGNIENNMNHMMDNWNGEYIKRTFNLNDFSDELIGKIEIGSYGSLYYMDNDVDFLKEINKVIFGIGILMTLITIIIAIVISNNISRPIETVSDMANEIAEGGYNHKLEYKSDIFEIDTLIESINNLATKLEEQENLRKRLTTDISHELRTPLTSVQAHLEAMIDGIWEPNIERLNSVNDEVIRLTNLVNQLRNLSKFDSEKSILKLSYVNISNIIKNIVYNNESMALEKNINIQLKLESINIYLDKDKISQVIINLLSNAIRYTNKGGNILISAYKEGRNIKIHFKDDGIGISKNDIDYIFERFYRTDKSRSKETGGIGVGLTIVKSIVNMHRGKVEVQSELDEGSEFIVTLPIINGIIESF